MPIQVQLGVFVRKKNLSRKVQILANLACASSSQNIGSFKIHTPLIALKKSEIIQKGVDLGVDYSITHSCYDPQIIDGENYACGTCDSCLIRLDGFKKAGLIDKIKYI